MRGEIERLLAERKNCPPVSESEYVRRLEDHNARLEDRNAELLAALKALVDHADATILTGWRDAATFEVARAAIAKAEGK